MTKALTALHPSLADLCCSLPPLPTCRSMMRVMEKMVRETQDKVCAAIEEIDGCKFRTDAFVRPGGGGGITKVMQVRHE